MANIKSDKFAFVGKLSPVAEDKRINDTPKKQTYNFLVKKEGNGNEWVSIEFFKGNTVSDYDNSCLDFKSKNSQELLEEVKRLVESDFPEEVVVNGKVDYYFDKNNQLKESYKVQNIYKKREELDNIINQRIVFDKDCLMEETNGDLKLNAFISVIMNQNGSKITKYYPRKFIIPTSKYNEQPEQRTKLVNYFTEIFTTDVPKGMLLRTKVKSVAGGVELTVSDLTELQKQQIELGLASASDFIKRVGGDFKKIYTIERPLFDYQYSNGYILINEDVFDDNKIEIKTSVINDNKVKETTDADIDALLGSL